MSTLKGRRERPIVFPKLHSFASNTILAFATLACLSWSLAPSDAHAQKGVTSMGNDFWIGFMPNYLDPAAYLSIFVGSGTDNDVHVEVYGGSQVPVEYWHQMMTANSVWTVKAKSTSLWETRTTEQAAYRAIHVYSKNPIVVYGLSNVYTTTDSYLALPTYGLGKEYYPACYYDDKYTLGSPGNLAGEFLIVAPFDNTVVTIGPVKTPTRAATPMNGPSGPDGQTILHQRGETWSVTLMRGQTYMVQSTGLAYGDDDITGTHIIATRPVGLLSGHVRASIPIGERADQNGSKNHLIEMIPPLDRWGDEYYDMPMAGRILCGDMVRVIAGEDGVNIMANGNQVAQLVHAGDFADLEQILDPTVFTSNNHKKFLAVMYSYSYGVYDDPSTDADPFIIVLTPKEQYQKKLIFRTPDNAAGGSYRHYATFITATDSILKIQINGRSIGSYEFVGQAPIPGSNPPMTARRIKLPTTPNTYVATCGSPFGCYLYGFSYADGYGHPAGMALGMISPDTLPPLQKYDSLCGNFDVQLQELRHFPKFSFEDTRIADVGLITDTGDIRWPKPSYNYAFAIDPNHPFTPGDSLAYFTLTLQDPSKDAYAAVWTTDYAGNDTVYEYSYVAPKLVSAPKSPLTFEPVHVTSDSCSILTLKNNGTEAIHLDNASVRGSAQGGKFVVTPSSLNRTLNAGDTMQLHICFTSFDTVTAYDTVDMNVGCIPYPLPVVGTGVTPQILASDLDFGNVLVGDTVCKDVTIKNVGKWPLIIDNNWLLHNTKDFSFSGQSQLPITIPPGQSALVSFCFHPSAVGPAEGRQDWGTNLVDPFLHSIKDTSYLVGAGIQAGLNWDRSKQDYTVQCDPQTIRVNLLNTSSGATGASINVDSIAITGQDKDEFSIVANQSGQSAFQVDKEGEVWVDVQFTPNFAKAYAPRKAQLIAYGSDKAGHNYVPVMDLSATVRHANARITPPSYAFGTNGPGTPLSTTFVIHNDGDTNLVLNNLTIGNGYTISGFTPGESVPPGGSITITVTGTAQIDSMNATITASPAASCVQQALAYVTSFGSDFGAQGTGADYGDVYVCQDSLAVVNFQLNGSKPAILKNVTIVDTLGTTGANQYTFVNGSHGDTLNATMQPGDSKTFTIRYTPQLGGGSGAMVLYHVIVPDVNGALDTTFVRPLSGLGLHFANTVSARKDFAAATDTVYTAMPDQTISVPIHLQQSFDPKAKIYAISYTLRYRKDMFRTEQIFADNGLTGSTNQPVVTPDADPNYVLLTIKETSTTPIQTFDTIAHVVFRYMVNKDSTTPIEVRDVAFIGKDGNTVCWVTRDSIPGLFMGQDRCGNLTLRNSLLGLPPVSVKGISPNPAAGVTAIDYSLHESSKDFSIEVFDLLGNKVMTVVPHVGETAGDHTATFDTAPLASGTYFVRVTSGQFVDSRRLVVGK